MSGALARPFSNGSEHMGWDNHNCCRCRKGYRHLDGRLETENDMAVYDETLGRVAFLCEIQAAISASAMGDAIPLEIARRWGLKDNDLFAPNCQELEVTS